MILIGQFAFAEPAKTTQVPAKKGKNITIKLFESMTLDSGDKKPADKAQNKKTTAKKETKKTVEKKPVPKKPMSKKVIPKKPVTKTVLKTKHDTAKNSISNVR